MPYGNPGFDFLCGLGFKIEVKSSCLRKNNSIWTFNIRGNKIADYFLLLAFNNRKELDPLHVWLIPGKILNEKLNFGISNKENSIKKWHQYERELDKIIACCATMKGESK